MTRTARRFFPHPLLSGFMVLAWLLMSNSFSPGNILLGAVISWAIPFFTQSFWPRSTPLSKPLLAVKYLLRVIVDIIVANIEIAILILGPRHKLQPAFVRVPLDLKDGFTITLFANTISLTPGTVSVDLHMEEGYLLVHGINLGDPEAAIAEVKQRYEEPLKEMFECSTP